VALAGLHALATGVMFPAPVIAAAAKSIAARSGSV
jgi:hypothetical protein